MDDKTIEAEFRFRSSFDILMEFNEWADKTGELQGYSITRDWIMRTWEKAQEKTKSSLLKEIMEWAEGECKCNCFCNFSNEHRHFSMRKCDHCDGNGKKQVALQELKNHLKTL